MARRRKRSRDDRDPRAGESAPKPVSVTTGLGALLEQAGVGSRRLNAPERRRSRVPPTLAPPGPEPSALATTPPPAAPSVPRAKPLSTTELRLLNDAYEGARPLTRKAMRARPPSEAGVKRAPAPNALAHDRAEELAARARLAALVSEAVPFKIQRDDDHVQGLRADTSPKLLARLQGQGFTPEAQLDLHGLRVSEVGAAVERFVRQHHRRGARHVLLITGKGLHSEAGVSALGPAVVEALSSGLAAPWVIAFSSAHPVHGGSGAFAVLLRD